MKKKQYNYEMQIELVCEKCKKVCKNDLNFTSEVADLEKAYTYEYGEKKDQIGKYWWTCDCGGSMYVIKHYQKN